MQIIGIEVIRGNPGNPGVIGVPAGEKLPVEVGDTVRVHMVVDYRGDDLDGEVYTAIGWQTGIIIPEFIEAYVGRNPVHFDKSANFAPQEIVCDVPIEPTLMPIEFALYGNALDIYAKIINVPGPDIFTDPFYYKVIEVVEIAPPPEYELIQHTVHPAAYVYEDEAEICTIEFPLGPEQIPFTQWGGLRIAEAFASAVETEGNTLLEVKVYEDATPLLWTNYRVEIKAAVASEGQGVAVWPWLIVIGGILVTLPWAKIILGVLGILGIWVVGWVIERLIKAVDRVMHKPSALTDEIIDGLGREDLIPMILYKAPRVEYEVSPEELEAMSDDGLRALLKELRDRQVREEMEWWPLALVGGVAVLGVGAAVALAARPRG